MAENTCPEKKFAKKVGYLIRSARDQAGISQEALAELIGKSSKQLSGYENGHNLPNVIIIRRIAAATNKPMEFFAPDDCLSSVINE